MSFLPGKIAVTCFYLQPCNPPPLLSSFEARFLVYLLGVHRPASREIRSEKYGSIYLLREDTPSPWKRYRTSPGPRQPHNWKVFPRFTLPGVFNIRLPICFGGSCVFACRFCLSTARGTKKSVLVANQVKSLAPIISYYKEWRMAPRGSLRSVRVN